MNFFAALKRRVNIVDLGHDSYRPARKTGRLKKLARAAGLVEYWRARSWPAALSVQTISRAIDVKR